MLSGKNLILSVALAAGLLSAGASATKTTPQPTKKPATFCRYSGYDSYHGGHAMGVISESACMKKCLDTAGCVAYTHSNQGCWVKDGLKASEWRQERGKVTGVLGGCDYAKSLGPSKIPNNAHTGCGESEGVVCRDPFVWNTSSQSCSCAPGFYSTPSNKCAPVCPPNQYPKWKSSQQKYLCESCPAGSKSNGQSLTCTCTDAFQQNNNAGQCDFCKCPAGWLESSNGRLCCPPHSTPGATKCNCKDGYRQGGTFGDGSLKFCYENCPADQQPKLKDDSSPKGGCESCPPRSSSTGLTKSCVCDPLTKSTGTNPAGQIRGCTECPAGYITSPCGRKCVLAPSQANYPAYKAKRAAEKKDDALCPKGLDACAISTSGLTGGYECVSLQDELGHCGACNNSCSAIPGIEGVACSAGQCQVISCQEGYEYLAAGTGTCRALGDAYKHKRHTNQKGRAFA